VTAVGATSENVYLKCGGIFNDSFIANLLESVPVKVFVIGEYLVKI